MKKKLWEIVRALIPRRKGDGTLQRGLSSLGLCIVKLTYNELTKNIPV
jgi:hypothetical protein